jgi:hypothetical protein
MTAAPEATWFCTSAMNVLAISMATTGRRTHRINLEIFVVVLNIHRLLSRVVNGLTIPLTLLSPGAACGLRVRPAHRRGDPQTA